MCVIIVNISKRMTEEQVSKAFDTNDDGAGIAWREDDLVHWRKGLLLHEIQELIATVPLPFVAHFRIASAGGIDPTLCHPFAIDKQASSMVEGTFKGHVLFHNGHWNPWKANLLDSTIRSNRPLPAGKWSDSRTMALLASRYGINVLDIIDEKAVVFSTKDIEYFGGTNAWSKVDDLICSNTHWQYGNSFHTRHSSYGEVNSPFVGGKAKQDAGGPPEETTFRNGPQPLSGGVNGKESVPKVSTSVPQVEGQQVALVTPEAADAMKWVRSLNPRKFNGTHPQVM